jgi:hypothetical protein
MSIRKFITRVSDGWWVEIAGLSRRCYGRREALEVVVGVWKAMGA